MVSALADAGFMSFFGAAGLAPGAVEEAVDELTLRCDGKPWGCNLIHSPSEPALERALADIYIRKNVRLIEASAYIDFTLPLVDFRLHGIHRMSDGRVIAPNRIIAKVSRAELASRFFAPPPESLTRELVLQGRLTDEQADMARRIPVAQDVTAEADSGGHTDNRPAPALLPTLLAVRDRSAAAHSFDVPLRVGAAGGIGTPHGAAAAFAAGAGWIVTGSVNQACLESGTSEAVKQILAETQQADVMMAPAADMFELGVKVQVLKRATMFPMRAAKLHEIYHRYNSIEAIPAAERAALEKNIFRLPIDEVWRRTQQFFEERDLSQLTRAKDEPKHRMALIFRWYLGQASHWAISGDPSRRIDYQIWCGPAMGAFNEWTQGTFMEKPAGRDVVTVALNILHGAAVLTRMQALRIQGLTLQARVRPLDRARLEEYLA
jgi:PfaD family protein